MSKELIRIGGAREHNLKNLTLQIPRDKLVVITGLSGSGKSSLAFDTIYAEGQRKYVESLSAYARQFLDQLQKPDVDFIEGLSPAIAIEQRSSGSSPRSIIATTTEIYDYLRLLYAHIGQPHCPETGVPIVHAKHQRHRGQNSRAAAENQGHAAGAGRAPAKRRIPRRVRTPRARRFRPRARGRRICRTGRNVARIKLDKKKFHNIEAVVDRLVIDDKIRVRLGDSVETALRWGEGVMFTLHQLPRTSRGNSPRPRPQMRSGLRHCTRTKCVRPPRAKVLIRRRRNIFPSTRPPAPVRSATASARKWFSTSISSCRIRTSRSKGAIQPWRRAGKRMIIYYKAMLRSVAAHFDVSTGNAVQRFAGRFQKGFAERLRRGRNRIQILARRERSAALTRPFEGVLPNLERLATDSESEFIRNRLKAYMSPQFCDACNGKRLKPEILAVTLGGEDLPPQFKIKNSKLKIPGLSIMDVCGLSVEKADEFFAALKLTEFEQKIAAEVVKEIRARLGFLKNVGLGYLTLDRESGTLSGGEAQRIRLATQIGAALVGVLYVLDEPSIGLHQRDNDRLLAHAERLARFGQHRAGRRTRCGHDSRGGLYFGFGTGRGCPRRRTGGGGNVAGNSGEQKFAHRRNI